MTHSPLPWRKAKHDEPTDEMPEYYSPSQILDSDGEVVADNRRFYPQAVSPDDQALIVRAVNAHAALVAALEAIVARSLTDELGTSKVIDMRNLAAGALKTARGEA